ncbi:Peptidyl-tRNA hydrolase [Nakaseomyces bracarensis]|uniref:peptidyl-tRNA hydrolase n=1 Tax=Nakaseomyces bracarensis TaxID=273131 RepID=A0ABR4NMX6_9SACH
MRFTATLRKHWCLTGIGNPEPQYRGSRHNVGLYVLDQLKELLVPGETYSRAKGVHILTKGCLTFIRSDMNYINLSGSSVRASWNKLHNTDFTVIHDELSLQPGKLQLRNTGASHRGHNGLKSIQKLGIPFQKLAIGIGRPESRDPQDVANYVLGQLTREELDIINNTVIPRALQLIKDKLQ